MCAINLWEKHFRLKMIVVEEEATHETLDGVNKITNEKTRKKWSQH